jgi:hypothetical protein
MKNSGSVQLFLQFVIVTAVDETVCKDEKFWGQFNYFYNLKIVTAIDATERTDEKFGVSSNLRST